MVNNLRRSITIDGMYEGIFRFLLCLIRSICDRLNGIWKSIAYRLVSAKGGQKI